jgi:hypothetical protein
MSSTIQDADGAVASRIELISCHGLALPARGLPRSVAPIST